jgi:nucleoid-associated protein YgaU
MASFEELKAKYQPVMDVGGEVGLSVQNLHTEGDKLLIRGTVPTGHGKNALWDEIKRINPAVDDVVADINVTGGTYTVQAGDTLSKIAKRFYGDANDYNKIFQANQDKLDDPDQIKVGQELTLPAE